MVQYDISEPVRNYRICLWEKFLFYWSRSTVITITSSGSYLWVIDNKFGKCYSDSDRACIFQGGGEKNPRSPLKFSHYPNWI